MDKQITKDLLEKEIRLMALDNILTEKIVTMLQDKLEDLEKDQRLDVSVRNEIKDKLIEVQSFWENGHNSLIGLKDAAGNLIVIDNV